MQYRTTRCSFWPVSENVLASKAVALRMTNQRALITKPAFIDKKSREHPLHKNRGQLFPFDLLLTTYSTRLSYEQTAYPHLFFRTIVSHHSPLPNSPQPHTAHSSNPSPILLQIPTLTIPLHPTPNNGTPHNLLRPLHLHLHLPNPSHLLLRQATRPSLQLRKGLVDDGE